MDTVLLQQLEGRRFSIRVRWSELLRASPVASPLANPETLAFLIDTTFEEILAACARDPCPEGNRGRPSACDCGLNPYLVYFEAGRQAMQEGLILAQVACPRELSRCPVESLERLNRAIEIVSRREIEGFCGVCRRPQPCHELG